MSRFNKEQKPQTTTNYAGGEAYKQDSKMELVSILLTSMVQDQAYRSGDEAMDRLRELIKEVDPIFTAKAAIYARNVFGMRSISHVAAGEIAASVKGAEWTKSFFDKVVRRPDDMSEILSYYYGLGKSNEPNALKKGFASALQRFDAYQLAKYKGAGKSVSLVDIVNLVHPKQTEAIKALVDGTLAPADTWETKLSAAGKADSPEAKASSKAQAWRDMVAKGDKVEYMALLRNLRNIIDQAPDVLDDALGLLTREHLIKKSLVLPFRYFTAYNEIRELNGPAARKTMQALATALEISVNNMPDFGENTLVAIDHSGSMDSHLSDDSKATLFETAALFGIALAKKSNADIIYFGDIAKYYNATSDSVISNMQALKALNEGGPDRVGHGTNTGAVFEEARQCYDKVFIFSDMQAWVGYYAPSRAFNAWRNRCKANPKVYSFDLAGYGSLNFPEENIACIAGFSEKTLDILKKLDIDKNALIKEIESVEL